MRLSAPVVVKQSHSESGARKEQKKTKKKKKKKKSNNNKNKHKYNNQVPPDCETVPEPCMLQIENGSLFN
jgi:hypothetical protein